MRGLPIILVVMVTAELCLSAPVDNDVSKTHDYEYGDQEDEDPSFIYQRMVWPDWRTLPKEFFGPEYVWDTKGFPRRADKVQARIEGTSDVSEAQKS